MKSLMSIDPDERVSAVPFVSAGAFQFVLFAAGLWFTHNGDPVIGILTAAVAIVGGLGIVASYVAKVRALDDV